MEKPEWHPRTPTEYLVWAGIAVVLGATLRNEYLFAAACVLYAFRVFLWPNVREQRRRERAELEDESE